MDVRNLPLLNAILNGTSAVLLVVGFFFIKRKMIPQHRAVMLSAFTISIAFLVSYLIYHSAVGTVRFTGTGGVRVLYFVILASHTFLAAIVPILASITLFRALQRRFPRHRQIARWTLPLWLYVSVTGIAIYVMLYRLYPPTP